MRSSRDIVAVVVLLLIFIAGGLMLGGRGADKSRQVGREETPDPSIYNDRASGSKGAWEWVGKLGYQPRVWRHGWGELGQQSKAPVLLIIDPRVDQSSSTLTGGSDDSAGQDKTILSAPDAEPLLTWVRAGHTAILMTSSLPGRSTGSSEDTFADALDLTVQASGSAGGQTEFAPLQPTVDTQGVISIHSEAAAVIKRSRPNALALFANGPDPVVLTIAVGQGRLVAIADSSFASNNNLPRSENAALLANLIAHAARPGDPILFDEYHHGEIELGQQAGLWAALGRPLQLSLIQLLLASVVLLGALMIRFGRPIPLLQGITRTSGEYVTSLAGLYRRAQATTTALDILYRQFLRDLCGRLALPPDVNLEMLAEAAARRGRIDKAALRRLLASCEQRLDEGKLTEAELLDLSRQMERIRKDMGIA